ncbi:MAG: sigma-70 family RNA polymerase sigma factor, partial [Actinomycetota bacterium]|nr:sigma-70 family RNA polymerase sigma factor [Actinomycetota bacterium]
MTSSTTKGTNSRAGTRTRRFSDRPKPGTLATVSFWGAEGTIAISTYQLPLPVDERRVVESGTSGHPDSLDLLYRSYAPALRAFCEARLGDPATAEDAAHEAILKAHAGLSRFRSGAPVWPWLATIAARVCCDMRRARWRAAAAPGVEELTPGPDQEVDRRITIGIVHDAMRALPERYRTHLYRRDYEGWSYEEIAEADGTSVGTVRSVLLRARRALKAKVADVAASRGQWPLPALVPAAWARLRARLATGQQ